MRDLVSPLYGANLSIAAFLKQPAEWKNSVLGALCFSADTAESRMLAGVEAPCMSIPMQRLDAGDSICEVWHGSGLLTQGQCGAIHYRHDDDVLFGVIAVDETAFAATTGKTPLQQATEAAYRQVFAPARHAALPVSVPLLELHCRHQRTQLRAGALSPVQSGSAGCFPRAWPRRGRECSRRVCTGVGSGAADHCLFSGTRGAAVH